MSVNGVRVNAAIYATLTRTPFTDIDPTEARDERVDHRSHRFGGCHIHRHCERLRTAAHEYLDRALGAGTIDVGDDHTIPLGREALGESTPQATPGTGDENHT